MSILGEILELGLPYGEFSQIQETRELNNTLKQIAKAQGIKIKSRAEIAKEKEEKHRKVEEYRKRKIIEAEAKEMGISVEEYKKIKRDERANAGAGVFYFIILLLIVYFVGYFLHSIGY